MLVPYKKAMPHVGSGPKVAGLYYLSYFYSNKMLSYNPKQTDGDTIQSR